MTDIKNMKPEKEILLPNITGCGDGLNKNTSLSKTRAPVPSSRKFTARTTPKDSGIKLKLEKSLNEMYHAKPASKSLGKKSKSIAEITPSSKSKKTAKSESKTGTTLLATPRKDFQINFDKKQAARIIYHRLLILTWRRNRARLSSLTESSKRNTEQINQLQLQLDVLQQLRKSECEKRQQAHKERRELKNQIEKLQLENQLLLSDKSLLEDDYNKLQDNLDSNNVELENYRNKLYQLKQHLKAVEGEKNKLTEKLSKYENTIQIKIETIKNLEEEVQNSSTIIHNLENSKSILESSYKEILIKYESENRQVSLLQNEVNILRGEKRKLEIIVENLQIEVSDMIQAYDDLKEENSIVQSSIMDLCQEKKSWWKNAKQLTNLSMQAMKIICMTMLPALPRYIQ